MGLCGVVQRFACAHAQRERSLGQLYWKTERVLLRSARRRGARHQERAGCPANPLAPDADEQCLPERFLGLREGLLSFERTRDQADAARYQYQDQ